MLQVHWLFLGSIAMVATGSVLITSIDEIIAGLAGAFAWGGFSLGSTNIVKTQGACCTYTTSEPMLGLLGGAMAIIMLGVALKGTVVMVAPRSTEMIGEQDNG